MFTTWLAIIFGVSVFLYVVQQRELYKFLSLQVLPHEWHMEVFAWSWGAFGGYFVFTAFLVAIKRAGAIRALQRGCRRAFRRTETVSAHKTVRQAWKRVWTAPRGGGKLQGANAASLALASTSGAGGSSSMVAEWEKRLEEPDYQMSPLVIGTKA
ncbi:hypothetical protein EON66_04660 [archaeon]|nr:MAG: hypothetical protein EON66_04660 [archaeon]